LPSFFSVHDSVVLIFNAKDFSSHRPGVWWLNFGLLQDTHFCEVITKTISEHVEYQCFPSLHDWWDFLKISFRDIAQDFSKQKQRNLNPEKMTATNLLIKAKHDLITGDVSATDKIEQLESKLQAINLLQNEAVKICSRAQWLEGGQPMKYFLALESTHVEKNAVKVISNADGVEVSSQQEIETARYDFYWKLYSHEGVHFHIQRNFLANIDVSLNDTDRTLMKSPKRSAGCLQGKHLALTDNLRNFMLNSGISYAQFCSSSKISVLSRDSLALPCKTVSRLIFKKDNPKT